MHQIRLYQSTWADAQQLMHRWGAWGHYDGSCTAASCKYEIKLTSISTSDSPALRHAWLRWLLTHDKFNLYEWLRGRGSVFEASFTVHDGAIWREGSYIGVTVPTRRMRRENDFEWSLSIGAASYQRLNRTLGQFGVFMGDSEDELAKHPYYKVGGPSGCMILCQIEVAYYSTRTPPAEIEHLTSYNFTCFTRFHPCAHIEDLLPVAKEWHLYDKYQSSPTVPIPPPRPISSVTSQPVSPPCNDIPVWAQARDARYVLSVEALSTGVITAHQSDGDYRHEVAKVRIVSSLKEAGPWLPGTIVDANPHYWLSNAPPTAAPTGMVPGKRYIVFAIGNDRRNQMLTKDSPLTFDRCGVRDDTPKIRQQLQTGFAQNDTFGP